MRTVLAALAALLLAALWWWTRSWSNYRADEAMMAQAMREREEWG